MLYVVEHHGEMLDFTTNEDEIRQLLYKTRDKYDLEDYEGEVNEYSCIYAVFGEFKITPEETPQKEWLYAANEKQMLQVEKSERKTWLYYKRIHAYRINADGQYRLLC